MALSLLVEFDEIENKVTSCNSPGDCGRGDRKLVRVSQRHLSNWIWSLLPKS